MKTIVAYDFDGTLTTKDSFLMFISHAKGRSSLYINLPVIFFYWLLTKLKLLSVHDAKEKIFSHFFKDYSLSHFNSLCDSFINKIQTKIRPSALTHIREQIAFGSEVIIISASIENWISPWANSHGISRVISTNIAIRNGKLTGRFSSKNCVAKEKVNRLMAHYPNREDYNLIAFGNSSGDKELLSFADQGYLNYFKY